MNNSLPVDDQHGFFQLPKLKSVVAVFFGLFCILCFKKLIGFGRRWKDILIDWGYRSVNVPSLWASDAVVDHDISVDSPATVLVSPLSSRANSKRVPALRVPDAWANFLLTWLHLNLNIVSSLVPVWISAINGELRRLSTRALSRDEKCPVESVTPYRELRIEAVRPPISPPRLSNMETSASGSTKELHFHCNLSSPEVFIELTTVRQIPDHEEADVTEHYVVHFRQVTCRVQIICAVLEGDYSLLSWKLVSPLLTQPFSLFNKEMQPVTELSSSDSRWIKDNLYLAIQSTVTRLVINPLCFTPIEQSIPRFGMSSTRTTAPSPAPREMTASDRSPDVLSEPQPFSPTSTFSPAMHLRVLYAVLLEPLELNSFDPLLTTPLRCRIQWNLTLARLEDHAVDGTDEVLLTTTASCLEAKIWPTTSQDSSKHLGFRRPLSKPVTNSFMVVWNQDAFVPVTNGSSNLLDVCLFTEPEEGSSNSTSICGHAILPLPKLNDDPAKSQHVLLVDCYCGSPTDDWHTVSKSPDVRARFMLILRVQLFSVSPNTERSPDYIDSSVSPFSAEDPCTISSESPIDAEVKWTNNNRQCLNLLPGDYSPASVRTTTGVIISPSETQATSSIKHNGVKKRFSFRRSLSKSLRRKNHPTHSTLSIDTPPSDTTLPPSCVTIASKVTSENPSPRKANKSKFRRIIGSLGLKSPPKPQIPINRRQSE